MGTIWRKTDNMLSRFHLILGNGGRTDGIAISISRVISMLTRHKNINASLMANAKWTFEAKAIGPE